MRRVVRRMAAWVMAMAMMAAVFVGNGVTVQAYSIFNPPQFPICKDLDGDLLIEGDTAHDAVHQAAAGQDLAYTGTLDITPIKSDFEEYASYIKAWMFLRCGVSPDLSKVYFYDGEVPPKGNGQPGVNCAFVATFTVPDGLTVNNLDAQLVENPLFQIGTVTYDPDNRQIEIKMVLKTNYTNYQALYDDIEQISEELNLTFTGVSVPNDAQVGDQYTLTGKVNGYFNTVVKVTRKDGSDSWTFPSFKWTGVQTADGADSVASDGINLTIEVVDTPVEPKVVSDDEHHGCHHKYEWDVVKKGTQTEDGIMKYRCIYCGTVEYEVPIAAYFIFNKDTQQDILHAAPNATVTAKTPIFISFHEMVQEALAERPDVTLVVDYRNDGKDYEMTIPAGNGATLDQLFGESQYAGFLYLGGAFATTEVTH